MISSLTVTDRTSVACTWWESCPGLRDRIRMDFKPGVNVIVGPSGSGRSTLLRTIARMMHAEDGASVVNYQSVNKLERWDSSRSSNSSLLGVSLQHDGKGVIYIDHMNRLSASSGSGPPRKRVEYVLKALRLTEAPEIKWEWAAKNHPIGASSATPTATTYQEKERAKVDAIVNSLTAAIEVGQPTVLIDNVPGLSFLHTMFLWDEILRASDKVQIITAIDTPWSLAPDPDVNHIAIVPGYLEVCNAALAFLKSCAPSKGSLQSSRAEPIYDEWKAIVADTTREKLSLTGIGYVSHQIGYSSSSSTSSPPSPPPTPPASTPSARAYSQWGDDYDFETSRRTSTVTYAGKGRSKASETVQGFDEKEATVGIAEPCSTAAKEKAAENSRVEAAKVAKAEADAVTLRDAPPPVSALVGLPKPEDLVTDGGPTVRVPTWSTEDIFSIQAELARLRYYSFKVDGSLGHNSQRALAVAYGGEGWRALGSLAMLDFLRKAAPLGATPPLTPTPAPLSTPSTWVSSTAATIGAPNPSTPGRTDPPRPSTILDIQGIDDLDELELGMRYGYVS